MTILYLKKGGVSIKKLFMLFVCTLLVTGCSMSSSNDRGSESNNGMDKESTNKIQPGNINKYEDSLIAEDVEEDIDGDGEKEQIQLVISPKPKEDPNNEGKYLWDDSQIWQLSVTDGDQKYTLFDDHVQGIASFYIVNEGDQNSIIFEEKGTKLSLRVFRYNENEYFEENVIYSNGPILHRSTVK